MTSDDVLAELVKTMSKVETQMTHVHEELQRIRTEYVRLERFLHVERIVLGISAALLTGIGAIVIPRLFGG